MKDISIFLIVIWKVLGEIIAKDHFVLKVFFQNFSGQDVSVRPKWNLDETLCFSSPVIGNPQAWAAALWPHEAADVAVGIILYV